MIIDKSREAIKLQKDCDELRNKKNYNNNKIRFKLPISSILKKQGQLFAFPYKLVLLCMKFS